jgi:hypothetical protein
MIRSAGGATRETIRSPGGATRETIRRAVTP